MNVSHPRRQWMSPCNIVRITWPTSALLKACCVVFCPSSSPTLFRAPEDFCLFDGRSFSVTFDSSGCICCTEVSPCGAATHASSWHGTHLLDCVVHWSDHETLEAENHLKDCHHDNLDTSWRCIDMESADKYSQAWRMSPKASQDGPGATNGGAGAWSGRAAPGNAAAEPTGAAHCGCTCGRRSLICHLVSSEKLSRTPDLKESCIATYKVQLIICWRKSMSCLS